MYPRFDWSMALLPSPRSYRLSRRCPSKSKADAQILRGTVPVEKEPSMEETPNQTMTIIHLSARPALRWSQGWSDKARSTDTRAVPVTGRATRSCVETWRRLL